MIAHVGGRIPISGHQVLGDNIHGPVLLIVLKSVQ